jgi:hypothetical protein
MLPAADGTVLSEYSASRGLLLVLLLPLMSAILGLAIYSGGIISFAILSPVANAREIGWWVGAIVITPVLIQSSAYLSRRISIGPITAVDLWIIVPWLIAASHQILPYWSDAAHYMNSSVQLYEGLAKFSDVVLMTGDEVTVQGDFHGPTYLFLHWPYALSRAMGAGLIGASALAFSSIILLKITTIVALVLTLKRHLGAQAAYFAMLVLFFLPYTRYILTGTHREWFLLYACLLLLNLWSCTSPQDKKPLLLAGMILAQSHVLSLLVFASLVLAVLVGATTSFASRINRSKLALVVLGGLIGFLPLIVGTFLSGLGRGVGVEVIAQGFGSEALQAYDRSRISALNLPYVAWNVPVPPLSLPTIGITCFGVCGAIYFLARPCDDFIKVLSRLVLSYTIVFTLSLFGIFDLVLSSIGISGSWFSLAKLLASNDRYWFLFVAASTIVAVSLVARISASRPRHEKGIGALALGATFSLASVPFLAAVLLAVHGAPTSALRNRLMPGAAQTPASDYIDFFFNRFGFDSFGLVFFTLLSLAVSSLLFSSRVERTSLIVALTVVASLSASVPVNSYARGTTSDVLKTIENWDIVRASVVWDDGCFVAAHTSTHRLFFDRVDLPVVYSTAPKYAVLFALDGTEGVSRNNDLPCAIFEDGYLNWASPDSIFNRWYEGTIREGGFFIRFDKTRVSHVGGPLSRS